MATRYWVGGSGNWNATSTTNWAATSGGASGASAPTSIDDVIFDANSNTLLVPFTVTVTGTSAAPAVCQDFSTGGAGGALDAVMTLTMGATAALHCYGSMTLPASNFTCSATTGASISFVATTTGKTLTSNGVSLSNIGLLFNGGGGEWTLGSAISTTSTISILNGSLVTNNYNVTCTTFGINSNSNTKAVTLGSSIVTVSTTFTNSSTGGLTFNAGTSTISCTSAGTNTVAGGGITFYNLSFAAGTGTTGVITGVNTFNNLSIGSPAGNGYRNLALSANQTVNGVLTLGTANAPTRRCNVRSDVLGTQRTLTLNGSVATLADVDFRDIAITGSVGTLSGTRLGNNTNNSGITFVAGVNKYWNLAAGGNWTSIAWALTSGGAVNVNNFPLAQDTVIIENTGLNTSATITVDTAFATGTLNASTRSNAMTLATGAISTPYYGDFTLSSAVTTTGTGTITFVGYGITQTITSAAVAFTQSFNFLSVNNGTIKLADNLTTGLTATSTLTSGILDLNNNVLSTGLFNSTNTNTRVIAFGTGNITTRGSGTVWNTASTTSFSYTGTPTVNISNNSATATTVSTGSMTEAQALNFNYTTGTYTLTDTSAVYKTVNFTGFSGTIPNATRTIYGGLTFSAGMTLTAGANVTTFAATSGTNNITTAAKTLDFPITFFGLGGTFAFQDALTQGATRAFTITNGTVQLKASATSTTGAFATSGTNQKFLQSTTPGTQATLTQASGTVNASYLTIQDINAIGGATWFAPISQFNVDAGNNDGWDFFVQLGQYMYTRRKNKRLLINY